MLTGGSCSLIACLDLDVGEDAGGPEDGAVILHHAPWLPHVLLGQYFEAQYTELEGAHLYTDMAKPVSWRVCLCLHM